MSVPTLPRPTFREFADNGLAAYVFASRYARFDPARGRRETYPEAVTRVEALHRARLAARLGHVLPSPATGSVSARAGAHLQHAFAHTTFGEVLGRAFTAVAAQQVLPSLRSLQFGGEALRRQPERLFNCAFSPADRPAFFREYFYLLLCGTGCGFSVQTPHIGRLPALPTPPHRERIQPVHRVEDSLEGWALALDHLITARYAGHVPRFDYSAVRPRGTPLRTAGGFAAGPEALRDAFNAVDAVLAGAAGRRLRSIEVYDACLALAGAVLAGGVRRAASICLFSADDEALRLAKTGDWQRSAPWRTAANNAMVLLHGEADEADFRSALAALREYGEPGFFFSADPDYGCNPCGEAGLHPVLHPPWSDVVQTHLDAAGLAAERAAGARLSGWQVCNLTTINGVATRDEDDLFDAALHAAVLGTVQAAYTDLPFLGPVTRCINELDALLGVSLCGFMDNPGLLLDGALLEETAGLVKAVNASLAPFLGLPPAARTTCVKPEGTASLLLGTSAGIHARPAHRYFRRVRASRHDPVFQAFAAANPEMVEAGAQPDEAVLVFPLVAPPGAHVRTESDAIAFLERVLLVQRHWVLAGEAVSSRSPGLHHHVSHTCVVRDDEWPAVADFLWAHREPLGSTTLLAESAVARYGQAPELPAVTADDADRWNRFACRPVDYTQAGGPSARPVPLIEPVCELAPCAGP